MHDYMRLLCIMQFAFTMDAALLNFPLGASATYEGHCDLQTTAPRVAHCKGAQYTQQPNLGVMGNPE